MKSNHKLIDVSHTVKHGLMTYRGLPAPIFCDYLSREASREHYGPGTEFHIGKIEMVANTGTYVDSPFHRYPNGKDLAQLPLSKLANLDGIVIRAGEKGRVLDVAPFKGLDLQGKAVLVETGWSAHWGCEQYFEGHPYLTRDAAVYLRDAGAVMVGIDSLNIDDTTDPLRPVHTILLGSEIPIVEHLTNLNQLPDREFHFFAVPIKIAAFGSFPVRAFGVIDS